MNFNYNKKRTGLNLIMKKYQEYLNLYAWVNNGSTKGATPFGDFYLYYTYINKYEFFDRSNNL